MSSSSVTLKALGLNIRPNALDLPNGSMSKASNVVINDGTVEQRRGFKLWGTAFGTSNNRVSQLFSYKERILRQYATTIQYDATGSGSFSSFNGSYTVAQTGLRTKAIESNGNLYFTSSEGIKVISASSADDFTTSSGFITNAGVPKAIDFKVESLTVPAGSTGFLPQDSTVAYKTTWAIKDANDNLKIGAPSQAVILYNSILELMLQDFNSVLLALDENGISPVSAAFLNDKDYVNTLKLGITASADDLRTNLIALAAKIDADINYADDSASGGRPFNIGTVDAQTATKVRIALSVGTTADYFTIGDKIYLSGFGLGGTSSKDINGAQTITNVNASYIEFDLAGGGMTPTETFSETSGTIVSYRYRNINQPSAPSLSPTAAELLTIQVYLETIISTLQEEPTGIISSGNMTDYIAPLGITESVNAKLTIQIPSGITTDHFLQVYRSTTVEATGTDILGELVPNGEETQLVYEGYPTSAEISAGQMIVNDITVDIFKGANLYTNASTGEGILQANDIPPFALDINKFKNTIFYANTKTKHRIIPFSMIGIANMISDYDAGTTPSITISNGTTHNTYTFVTGVKEVTPITFVAKANLVDSEYFVLNTANDEYSYYFWFDKSGSATDPAISGKTGVKIDISDASVTTATQVAQKARDVINTIIEHFTASENGAGVLTVTNVNYGGCTDATEAVANASFQIGSITQGRGESISGKQILLSDATSVAVAVDETARSMVRVINGNSSEITYLYYTSTTDGVPGKMVFEAKTLSDTPFYIISNNSNTGGSFFPNISPVKQVTYDGVNTVITVNNPTSIYHASHGLSNGDQIVITGSNSTPSIDGLYTVTVTGANTFTIPVNVTIAGTKLSYTEAVNCEVSQNEDKLNRIYYSKSQQPEAVPIVNYFDVGAADKEILRIFPLRDSLFVFKEDGLYRISGETAPFYVSLFDSSCILVAPDSVDVSNNLLYGFTRQGIASISEAGVSTVSRNLDNIFLRISSSDYTNFATATWGVGYESDNSYTVYTVEETTDDHAMIGYRYDTLDNTWTSIDKDSVCGIINPVDDKMYLGAGDTNFIEQERKSFTRLDYADREISSTIADSLFFGDQIQLSTVSGISAGDVIVQEQWLTPYKFNALLSKLDLDPSVGAVTIQSLSGASTTLTITTNGSNNLANGDYVIIENNTSSPSFNGTYEVSNVSGNQFDITINIPLSSSIADGTAKYSYRSSLEVSAGDNLRTQLVALAAKLDTDPGLVETNYSTLIANTGSKNIQSASVGDPTTITTTTNHGFYTGRNVTIASSDAVPSINGNYVVTRTGASTFTIDEEVVTAGTTVGTVTPQISSFLDIKGCFNLIVDNLNIDTGASFSNYKTVDSTTAIESVITDVSTITKRITLRDTLDFIVGPITIYKAIESEVIYTPNTMSDPLGMKHLREATIMFMNKAFTSGTLSFATDLLPEFVDVEFNADGNGIFGSGTFGQGFFGGSSNSAPMRTLIPRNAQRCRFLVIKFKHNVAREQYIIYGITITGKIGQSTRAYR